MEQIKLILTDLTPFSRMREYLHKIENSSYTTETDGNFSQQSSFGRLLPSSHLLLLISSNSSLCTLAEFSPPLSLSTAIQASLQLFCYYCVQNFSKKNPKLLQAKICLCQCKCIYTDFLPGKKYLK